MQVMRGTIWSLPLFAAAALLALPAGASGQMVVRSVIVGNQVVKETDQVRRSRFADMVEEPKLALNTRLEAGDLIWTANTTVLVELECGSKTRTPFRLSNGFRAVVLPPTADVPCVLQLLAGGVDVQAEEGTVINAGGIVLGSRGTTYAVRLRRTSEGAVCDGAVYEGQLDLRPPGRDPTVLATGRFWRYDLVAHRGQQSAISTQSILESARIHALFDLTEVNPLALSLKGTSPAQTWEQLATRLLHLHVEVLRAPADPVVRSELGKVQQQYGIARGARYNLMQLERIRTPKGGEQPR
jgi:hypothetical protein